MKKNLLYTKLNTKNFSFFLETKISYFYIKSVKHSQ